jgi:cytochrome c-type biogenesis protein CcmH/NrfG
MCPFQRRQKHYSRALLALIFAAFSGVLGLGFTLVKSPESRSEAYDQAAAAALEAVRHYPLSLRGWDVLGASLAQNGQSSTARKAQQIAARLRQDPSSPAPLYALPADLRLSLLADTAGQGAN